jgi:hypothetical protein
MSTEPKKNWFTSQVGTQVLADFLKANQGTTTPIQTKFIVTEDKSLPNDKGVTINLKKGDILQGLSRSSWGNSAVDAGGASLTFTDKDGNKFSVSTGGRGDKPFFEALNSPIGVEIPVGQAPSPEKPSTPLLSRLFNGGGYYTKNLPLLLLAVVAGYFAYKKFKK